MSYLWAINRNVDFTTIWLLSIGGFFITAASNIFNQILEVKSDGLMKRTSERPLPAGRVEIREAAILGFTLAFAGLLLLLKINVLSFLLGCVAILFYVCVYTPLKKITWLTVVPGALAGSLPVLIGCTAAIGKISEHAIVLFLVQFIWQFPHTWSVAWLLNDDYNKAGFKMLPTPGIKSKHASFLIMLSTFLIVPAVLLLYMYESVGIYVLTVISIFGGILFLSSFVFYKIRTEKSALTLMLGCIVFLPVLFILLVAEKFI
jgi:protoheme IX farnesyltransferase